MAVPGRNPCQTPLSLRVIGETGLEVLDQFVDVLFLRMLPHRHHITRISTFSCLEIPLFCDLPLLPRKPHHFILVLWMRAWKAEAVSRQIFHKCDVLRREVKVLPYLSPFLVLGAMVKEHEWAIEE